jgi:hypothetical protein
MADGDGLPNSVVGTKRDERRLVSCWGVWGPWWWCGLPVIRACICIAAAGWVAAKLWPSAYGY